MKGIYIKVNMKVKEYYITKKQIVFLKENLKKVIKLLDYQQKKMVINMKVIFKMKNIMEMVAYIMLEINILIKENEILVKNTVLELNNIKMDQFMKDNL